MTHSYIIAIDFGTSYSGYAFTVTSRQDDSDLHLKYWGEEVGLETLKAPTCILFDEHEEFMEFGYRAKDAYLKMQSDDARKKLFFDCFKMELYGKKLKKDLTVKAANDKSMNAMKVVSETLRFLKEDALNTMSKNTYGSKLIASDFTWVLTVPAIWDPSAKQFMREAATQAGIVTSGTEDRLVIALEPEAASVWCKKLPADGFITQNHDGVTLEQQPGIQYIVVDCGGGTIDITVHEVLDRGRLKELHKASGNGLGGQTVDRKFREFLREIFCDGVWEEFEREFPSEVQKLMYNFTIYKRHDDDVEISCPFKLGKIAQKKKDIEEFFKTVSNVSWDEGTIRISKDKLRSFFDESLQSITEVLREILQKDLKIEYILLVGGFADSYILRQHVKDEFGDSCKVLCPSRPQEVILKGAVQFGRNPAMVVSRISTFTYGIEVRNRFDESKHKAGNKYTDKYGVWSRNMFWKLVERDEDVCWNKNREFMFQTIRCGDSNKKTGFNFFRTEKTDPEYTNEDGVEKIGSFVVESPRGKPGEYCDIKLEITFGFTEMKATATDIESGLKETIKLDFMTK
ncbi:heat shock 70 kDa protein 12A-like [Pholidichthys leucotaenia]